MYIIEWENIELGTMGKGSSRLESGDGDRKSSMGFTSESSISRSSDFGEVFGESLRES